MPRLSPTVLLFCAAAVASQVISVSAQDAGGGGVRQVDQVTFTSSQSASVQLATGTRLRCDLVSMTSEKLIVRNNQRQNEIEMSKVRSIRSTDGKFEYSPAQEDFDSLIRRSRRIPGVSVVKVQVFDDPEPVGPDNTNSTGAAPNEPLPTGQPLVVPGPGRGNNVAPPPAATGSNADGPPASSVVGTEGTNPATPEAPRGTAICANCLKEIPATLQNGDRCPHCGVIFWDVTRPIAPAPTATPTGHQAGGGGVVPDSMLTARGQKPLGQANGGGVTVAAAPPQPGVVPTTTTTTPAGGGFDNIPMTWKVGAFVGMLAIGWLLLQRR